LILNTTACRAEHKLPYPLVFLDPMAANVVKVAQSQLEWLRDTLMRVFDHTRENPFACRRDTPPRTRGRHTGLLTGQVMQIGI
jgi:hypothetical protein